MRHADVGQVCWTTLTAPGGLVEILWLTRDATWGHVAQIRHLLDHPYGYAQGTIGWYPLRDLQPCYWPEEDAT